MNEEQRLSYLRSMGYQVYYPKAILPGAKPSPEYQLPATDEVERAGAGKEGSNKYVKPPISSKSDSERHKATPRPTSATLESAPPNNETTVESESKLTSSSDSEVAHREDETAGLQFSLQYFAINDQLAVINEEPHQIRGKQQKDSIALLRAILCTLIGDFDAELKGEVFDWPLAESLGDTEPERAAQLALQGFINQRQTQEGFSNLLVFTAQLSGLLNQQAKDLPLGDVSNSLLQCQLTLTHSLHSMLVVPLLKKEVWSHLQPLRSRLQND